MGGIQTEAIHYGDADMVGHLAFDPGQAGPRPAVLVVHEWWGRNEYACGRAEQLAGMGYVHWQRTNWGFSQEEGGAKAEVYAKRALRASPESAG